MKELGLNIKLSIGTRSKADLVMEMEGFRLETFHLKGKWSKRATCGEAFSLDEVFNLYQQWCWSGQWDRKPGITWSWRAAWWMRLVSQVISLAAQVFIPCNLQCKFLDFSNIYLKIWFQSLGPAKGDIIVKGDLKTFSKKSQESSVNSWTKTRWNPRSLERKMKYSIVQVYQEQSCLPPHHLWEVLLVVTIFFWRN